MPPSSMCPCRRFSSHGERPDPAPRLAAAPDIPSYGERGYPPFMATIRAEVEHWQTFIKHTGIKLE